MNVASPEPVPFRSKSARWVPEDAIAGLESRWLGAAEANRELLTKTGVLECEGSLREHECSEKRQQSRKEDPHG